jgi:hypothetical protein
MKALGLQDQIIRQGSAIGYRTFEPAPIGTGSQPMGARKPVV